LPKTPADKRPKALPDENEPTSGEVLRKQAEDVAKSDAEDLTTIDLPVDTDDNDEPDSDASGDSDDETPNENEAPEGWQKGEE
jgi:hypothetical protein